MKNSNNVKEEKIVKVDILDVLLDDENIAPIYMYNDTGECIEFDQIAVFPIGEDVFAVLKPITKVPEINENEGVVFKVVFDDVNGNYLKVADEAEAIEIFEMYYNLLEEELL